MPKLLTPGEFGQAFDPPRVPETIMRWCREGRITGVLRVGGRWIIPEGARVKGVGRRIEDTRRNKGISVGEYADIHGVTPQRVYQLLWTNRIEGATKGDWGWDIPEDAPWPSEQEGYA